MNSRNSPGDTLMRRLRRISPILLALVIAACAPEPRPTLPSSEQQFTVYRLGPGDRLNVRVFGEEELTGEYVVSDQGEISFPLLGKVDADGETIDALEVELQQGLSEGYLVRPSVSVEIAEYRPFYILGAVAEPGQYEYSPGMTVLSAVAVGGGFNTQAVSRRFTITRTLDGQTSEWEAQSETIVRPGDVVFVFPSLFSN